MTKHEIVWSRLRSRVGDDGAPVDLLIAAVPGGHLVLTRGAGASGLCFVPGKSRAVGKLIARTTKEGKPGKAKPKPKPKPKRRARPAK